MSTDTMRNRRLLIVASTMFALAVCVFGGLFYLRSRATAQNTGLVRQVWGKAPVFNPDGTIDSPGHDPKVDKALLQKAIARGKTIREKFRPWALRHKDVLQRMLDAQATDEAALEAVYDAIPGTYLKGSGLSNEEDLGGGDPPFSWNMKGVKLASYAVCKKFDKDLTPAQYAKDVENFWKRNEEGLERSRKMRRQEFQDYRDMLISDSVNSGRYTVQLYVSGRMTQVKYMPGLPKPGHLGLNEEVTEIVPPYDFLRSRIPIDPPAETRR